MATNKLTEVAGLVAQAVMGAKVKDKDGNTKTVKPTGDDNLLDLTDIVAGGSTGGNTGGGTDPNHPTAGADYYAGSLADGEITGRYLLYQRDETVAETTASKTVTLLRDVGSKFNMTGDGATFLIHIQKTVMTKGAKGAVTDIELNYDPKNVAKNGYFTTTSPYPIYIKASDLGTKKMLSIPINGIGESLSGKNVKVPQLNVTFNGDGTITYESVTGYDNDGNPAGATGANYDVVVDVIATFSVQPAVAQLPDGTILFSGLSYGPATLSGSTSFFENVGSGIEIETDGYIYFCRADSSGKTDELFRTPVSNVGNFPTKFNIAKEMLINGEIFMSGIPDMSKINPINITQTMTTEWQPAPANSSLTVNTPTSLPKLIIGLKSINTPESLFSGKVDSNYNEFAVTARIKITTIKSYMEAK